MSLRQDRKEYWECFEKYTDKANNRMLELEAKYEKLWKLDLLRVYDIKEEAMLQVEQENTNY